MARRSRQPLTEPTAVPTVLVTGWQVGRVDSLVHLVGWATMSIGAGGAENRIQVRVATTADAAESLAEQITSGQRG